MLMDGSQSEELHLDGDHLANIPVELPGTSGILQEVTSNRMAVSQRDKQETSRLRNKKWRRLKGKENFEMVSGEQQGAVLDMKCRKR